jgi:hypothetical protein
MKVNIVIPMAGMGSRFNDYDLPKPLIKIFGESMISHVVKSLNVKGNYIYIVQKDHLKKYDLENLLNLLTPNCNIISINEITEGAAKTTLFAKDLINNEIPLILANSDQIIKWNSQLFIDKLNKNDFDGIISLFKDLNPKWSYAQIENGLISNVAEKKIISDNATVGIYGWKHGSDYVKYAEQMIKKNIRTNNEFYVCPVYNEAIQDNKKILPFFIEKMHGVGTPEDLERFIKYYETNIS